MLKRKISEVIDNRDNKVYKLRLECGHTVKRRDSGRKKPPGFTYCDECQIVLDRLSMADDLVSARQIRTNLAVLKFLENEGHVVGTRPHYSQAVYWKINRRS